MRLIDADKAKAAIKEICDKYSISYGGCGGFGESIAKVIDLQPVIGVEPVRHGRWIPKYVSKKGLSGFFECSECNKIAFTAYPVEKCPYNYCSNCGAKMDQEDNP